MKIHPDIPWLWGTCLEYVNNEAKDKNGKITKILWMLLDETSETFSIWNSSECPFCKKDLCEILKNETNN